MTGARITALLAILSGVALAGTGTVPPPREALVRGGYTVLAGDFHVHGFPDGIPPWDSAREARRRRLDAIALTSHNSMVGWWLWTHAPWMQADARGVIVMPGEELTSVWYHMAIVGLSQTVPWHQPMAASAAAAQAQGAVAILAHPGGTKQSRVMTDDALRSLDGIEVAHPAMEHDERARAGFLRNYQRAIALKSKTAAIGSSDFHYFAPIGLCRTYLFVREPTADGILEAIREARTVACDARGNTYGPAGLASMVSDRCREDASLPPAGDSRLSRAGTWLAWAGLLGMVIAGASDR